MDADITPTISNIWKSLSRAQVSPTACHENAQMTLTCYPNKVGLRPTVWLCHSLGSSLAKEVLMFDRDQGQNSLQLHKNLRGVLFYGAPHNVSFLVC